jgi:hypothetical protein
MVKLATLDVIPVSRQHIPGSATRALAAQCAERGNVLALYPVLDLTPMAAHRVTQDNHVPGHRLQPLGHL